MAVAAIIRSAIRLRGWRPVATTAAVTRPYMRAASASNGTGSNSLSARCRASVRRARSSCSSYLSCSLLGRTWCGPDGQFGEGDCADRHFVREFRRVNPAAQDYDVSVEQALAGRFA